MGKQGAGRKGGQAFKHEELRRQKINEIHLISVCSSAKSSVDADTVAVPYAQLFPVLRTGMSPEPSRRCCGFCRRQWSSSEHGSHQVHIFKDQITPILIINLLHY